MDTILIWVFTVVNAIAILALISSGLAVIFGMMRVINFAHGEFLMLGGYATILACRLGLNIWVAIFVVAPLTVGLIGCLVERLIIRRMYGNLVGTMLATWGLSLFLIGGITAIFGNTINGVSAPLGTIRVGSSGYTLGAYQVAIVAIAFALVAGGYVVLMRTRVGLVARATMLNPELASVLGFNQSRIYAVTFTLGAALSGFAGALLAPISGVTPHMGAAYVAKAFVTVICGGGSVVAGLMSAATVLGPVEALVSVVATPIVGQAALLLVAIVLLRIYPKGISGLWTGER
ncbi:branched-chain amino acid ABC transporter permease [Burkholderia contaminans]|uniref:Branched-chain amino acid ABC transporter permease n=1 Tax=Burkholderia contaminans TaxID=488447 RepID=A0A3N8PVI0_9BURK|nr:branched-chain amino acid ABC transporter permease [Burkholderia contaminans]RQT15000.1 branched-chain amino acid ABC transporter permease [Burkholderia contaminans]